MSLNTKVDSVFSVEPKANSLAAKFLKLNRLKSETLKNNSTKSELDLIYLENSVILQVKRKNQPVVTYYGFEPKVAKRIKSAWQWEAEADLMAIAALAPGTAPTTEDSLLVMSCDLKTWEIPFTALPSLERIPQSERGNFEIDADGSYLYWECSELHLDLEDIKAAVDPEFKEQLLLAKLEYGKTFGKALAAVRKAHQLNQDAIDGISDRHLRRIENEGQQPTLDALKKLAKAHQMNLEEYLAEVNRSLFNTKF